MSFPSTSILDDFNRSNEGPPPSSEWTTIGSNGLKVSSNTCIGTSGYFWNVAYFNARSYGPPSEYVVEVYVYVSTVDNQAIAVGVRTTDDVTDGYRLSVDLGDNGWTYHRYDNGSQTVLDSGTISGDAVAAGDLIGIKIDGGTHTLYIKRSGESEEVIDTVSDSTYTSNALYLNLEVYQAYTSVAVDDFGGGDDSTFPNTPILDDFNRSNEGPPPSSDWTNSYNGLKVVSNECVGGTSDDYNASYWNTSYGPPDIVPVEAYATIGDITDSFASIDFEINTDIDSYSVYVNESGIYYGRYDDEVWTTLAVTETFILSEGDKLGYRIDGSVHEVFYKPSAGSWTKLFTVIDSTYTDSVGYFDLWTYGTGMAFDDFGGGNVEEYNISNIIGVSIDDVSSIFGKPISNISNIIGKLI